MTLVAAWGRDGRCLAWSPPGAVLAAPIDVGHLIRDDRAHSRDAVGAPPVDARGQSQSASPGRVSRVRRSEPTTGIDNG